MKVSKSNYPKCGLGLHATKNFNVNDVLDIPFTGTVYNPEQFKELEKKSLTDPAIARKLEYILEIKSTGTYLDFSEGGPLKFLNQAPSKKFANCCFILEGEKVKIKVSKQDLLGQEFFLLYDSKKGSSYDIPLMPLGKLTQQKEILEFLISQQTVKITRSTTK